MSHEKSGIFDDSDNITREEWNIYYLYLNILLHWASRIKNLIYSG